MKITPLAFYVLILLSGCGIKSERRPTNFVEVKTYFVKGDPEALIEGATTNTTSFITQQNIRTFNEFELTSMTVFTEKEEIIKEKVVNPTTSGPQDEQVTTEVLEAGNESEDKNLLEQETSFYSFRPEGGSYLYENPKGPLVLKFDLKGNNLDFRAIMAGGTIYPVTVLHYSLKNNKDAFSIMTRIQDSLGKNLMILNFARKSPQKIELADEMYKFIAGPGVKVKWDQENPIRLDICGPISQKTYDAYQSGVLMWKDALEGLVRITSEHLLVYPPFSDLNVQCTYLVKNYLTQQNKEIMNTASTIPTIDRFKGRLIDSDIIVWAKEIEKTGRGPDELYSLSKVIGHEFGHFLGLDHQFDNDIPSLMSYDDVNEVMQYDRDALRALYQN